MHAGKDGKHVSGAERIVPESELEETVLSLLRRPEEYDELSLKIEEVKSYELIKLRLPIRSFSFKSPKEAREFALSLLVRSGIPKEVANKAISLLAKGANPKGGNMRGAVIMDPKTGRRLERDTSRGVRTVRFDWKDRKRVREILLSSGYTERTVDALALASKNIHCGVLAELCWSDDPNYVTGYVASPSEGYVRITPLKEKGDPLGGRVYFVDEDKADKVIECLEKRFVLIEFPK